MRSFVLLIAGVFAGLADDRGTKEPDGGMRAHVFTAQR